MISATAKRGLDGSSLTKRGQVQSALTFAPL